MPSYGFSLPMLGVMIMGNGWIENVIPVILSGQASSSNTARILAIGSQVRLAEFDLDSACKFAILKCTPVGRLGRPHRRPTHVLESQ